VTTKDQTGETEFEPKTKEGEGSDGAAGQATKEVEGLTAALKAERDKRRSLEAKLARLEGTVDGLKSSQKPNASEKEEKVYYSRAELKAAVEEGKITEAQMENLWEKQIEAKIEKRITERTKDTGADVRQAAKVEADLERYIEAYPDLTDVDSELRGKVQAAYDKLVGRGSPANAATEVSAIEMVVGHLQGAKGRKKQPEPHEETGGSGSKDEDREPSNDVFKGLNAKLKAHYKKMVERGMYKGAAGEKALKAELALARAKAN